MNYKNLGEGIYGIDAAVITATPNTVNFLKHEAARLPRQRARLCAHGNAEDTVHEMLIALGHKTCICPHAHPNKSESFHVIEGAADLVLFDDTGKIAQVISLGAPSSNQTFYFRINQPYFHTLIVQSAFFVIHETTAGPFRPHTTQFPAWAPEANNQAALADYLTHLRQALQNLPAQVFSKNA